MFTGLTRRVKGMQNRSVLKVFLKVKLLKIMMQKNGMVLANR